jgi:hypothetical protein
MQTFLLWVTVGSQVCDEVQQGICFYTNAGNLGLRYGPPVGVTFCTVDKSTELLTIPQKHENDIKATSFCKDSGAKNPVSMNSRYYLRLKHHPYPRTLLTRSSQWPSCGKTLDVEYHCEFDVEFENVLGY